jgi:ribose 5-phosphate isomerase A
MARGTDPFEREKRVAAAAAAELVESGMTIGLGTGTTVAHLLPILARRHLGLRCIATSPETEDAARELGLDVQPFTGIDHVDLAIDGADQVDPSCWLVKGGGGAHTREKIVATAAERFVVIVSSDKLVAALRPPVPLELLGFGIDATLREIGDVRLRDAPATPDDGVLADHWGPVADPAELARRLEAVPGVVEHGLFPARLVSDVLIGVGDGLHTRRPSPA